LREFDRQLTAARTELEKQQVEAANAKAAQQRIELELAKQQERAANAEKSLLELRERIKDRHVSDTQQKVVAAKLRPFAGQMVLLITFAGDNEITGIGNDIGAAIRAAGWNLTRDSGSVAAGQINGGILIEIEPTAPESTQKAAHALALALRAEGLAVDGPKQAGRVRTLFGGTFNGPVVFGEISTVTVTIAKKP